MRIIFQVALRNKAQDVAFETTILYVKVDIAGPCPVLVCSQEFQPVPRTSICKDFDARVENSAT